MDKTKISYGRMEVFVEGEKTTREIDHIEVSEDLLLPDRKVPVTFGNEQLVEMTNGDMHIINF